jgi:hypothetical protein
MFRGPSARSVRGEADGTESSHCPGASRNPEDGRASRAAAGVGRGRASGRQSLSTSSPPSSQHATAARRLHSGPEAVLLGAMALLGLVGLLHQKSARSSPSGLGDLFDSTPRGTQTRRRPKALGASSSGGLYEAPETSVKRANRDSLPSPHVLVSRLATSRRPWRVPRSARLAAARRPNAGHRILPGSIGGTLHNFLAAAGWAVLSFASRGAGTLVGGDPPLFRGGAFNRPSERSRSPPPTRRA